MSNTSVRGLMTDPIAAKSGAVRAPHYKRRKAPFSAEWSVEQIVPAVGSMADRGPPHYRARFILKGQLVHKEVSDDRREAEDLLWKFFVDEAGDRCSDLKRMVGAVELELSWSKAQSLAVARAFLHPPFLLLENGAHLERIDERKVGRPITVDALTQRVFNLAQGWQVLTGTKASVGEGAWFCRAVDAAADYMVWLERDGHSMTEIRKLLRREIAKLPHLRWVRYPRWGEPWVQTTSAE